MPIHVYIFNTDFEETSHKNNLSSFLTFLIMILKFLHLKKLH